MGNEQSRTSGLELEQKCVEVSNFWSLHSGTIDLGNPVSVFVREPLVGGSLWVDHTPLEKTAKNLMIYRHPCILKYISSWHKDSKFYLIVETVKPLSQVLPTLNTLEISIGLHSVLKALCFLHEKAAVSHNNICVSSIYVSCDGNWRLGGMEFLSRFVDTTVGYMAKTRSHRYNKSLDVNEEKLLKSGKCELIDAYAYAVLVNEVLYKKSDDAIPVVDFREFCKNSFQHTNIALRLKLSSILDHTFFNHEFNRIHAFLTELPLKPEVEKVDFFSTLSEKLRSFDEELVLKQLASLLLSRMVVLDCTAQKKLLPFVLTPHNGETSDGLFSIDNFKIHITPKIIHMFRVRDAQIRLFLLKYFTNYLKCFTSDQLQSQILPELLVGIKDVSDELVVATLHALAELVPILGSSAVIGGPRGKLFNDGRPTQAQRSGLSLHVAHSAPDFLIAKDARAILLGERNTSEMIADGAVVLPERPSPDGEEGETAEDVEQSAAEDFDNWEDWGAQEGRNDDTAHLSDDLNALNNVDLAVAEDGLVVSKKEEVPASRSVYRKKNPLPDLLELDIKTRNADNSDEIDFFQDMEPVIEASTKFLAINDHKSDTSGPKGLNLNVVNVEEQEEGWGDDADWE